MKLPNGMIVNLEARKGSVRMTLPFAVSLAVREPSPEVLSAMASFSASSSRSLGMGAGDGVNPGLTQGDVFPNEQTDYIYPKFRVLSALLIPGYYLDFSKEGVLKKSMPLLARQTLYADHVNWRVREWVGVVNTVDWDDSTAIDGAPGINSEMKVDWRKAPDIARGLLMKPPAVKAVSATVEFQWDPSHPELLEQGIFFRNLGQEIEGSIVRIVVTEIEDYDEVSFVYKGANPGSNRHLPSGDEEGLDAGGEPDSLSAPKKPTVTPLKPKETKKVKLTDDQKTKLGLTAHPGEEVADNIVIDEAIKLAARAAAADPIVASERTEVLRLATLVEGVGEGDQRKLPASLSSIIENADASQLPGLRTLYQEKFDAAFPLACEHGHKATSRRSSVEQVKTACEEQHAQPAAQSYPGL